MLENIQEDSTIEENEEQAPKKVSPILKISLFAGGGIMLLCLALGVLFAMGIFSDTDTAASKKEKSQRRLLEAKTLEAKNIYLYNFPDLLVNLKSTGNQRRFLKLKLVLEAEKAIAGADKHSNNDPQKEAFDALRPRMTDQFQTFLRELTVEDLQGAAGLQRIREGLLFRANAVMKPIAVNNILFMEILIQ